MQALAPRLNPLVLSLCLFAASPLAMAQVTLNLSTAPAPMQAPNCVVTTDANGLTLQPGGTAMQATGVTFTGTACGGGSTFNAQLSVQQPNPQAGTASNVIWSASPAASQCYFAGSVPAGAQLAGWPIGTVACSSSATCSASNTTSVTPNAAGSYNLAIVCTNAGGAASGSMTASAPPLPPQPANFALTAAPISPATSIVAGAAFNVSWTVNGATTCTGSASVVGGSSVTLPGWTDTTTTTSPRSVTAANAGTYALTLACSNAAGTTTSQTANVTVNPVTPTCNGPAGLTRQTVSNNVQYTNTSGSVGRDLTQYSQIWGFTNPTQPASAAAAWPGVQASSPIIEDFGRNNFIAAQFVVPVGVKTTWSGFISRQTYSYGLDLTAAISSNCGDFNPPQGAACMNTGANGQNMPKWNTNTALTNQCVLVPGTYYLNIKARDPSQSTGTCAASSPTCPISFSNNLTLN